MLYGNPAVPLPLGETVNGAVHVIDVILGPFTVIENVQFWPANEIAKLAVPLVVGVPEMAKVKFPEPVVKFPA